MAIALSPQLEALIQEDVAHGPDQSTDEFLACAVHMLHDQEDWFRENQVLIAARIEQGFASAERGDLRTPEQVRARMSERKQAWSQTHPSALTGHQRP